MLANMTSDRQIFFPTPDPEKKTSVSVSAGTGNAVLKLDDEWIGIDAGQSWFWTKEWQAGEREVNQHIQAREYEEFDSLEEMFQSLHDDQR